MATIIKTKLDFSKTDKKLIKREEYPFISRILRFSKKGIQISRTPDGKGRFWVDTEPYYLDNDLPLEEEFNVGDAVKMNLIVECFINKNKEYVCKPCLKSIEPFDEAEMMYWTHNQPTWKSKMEIVGFQQTDNEGLCILTAFRLDSEGKQQEKYFLRYNNTNKKDLELGTYKVDFDLYTSSWIVKSNGDIWRTFRKELGSEDPEKLWAVYEPYLQANYIYKLDSSKE